MNKRILFLTQYDETGASSRYMVYQFLGYFERAGFQTAVRPLICGDAVYQILGGLFRADSTLKFLRVALQIFRSYLIRYLHVIQAWSYDVVVVQKDVLPFGLGWLLSLGQKNIVLSFDDPIWLAHQGSGSRVRFWGAWLVAYRKRLLISLIKKSKLVVVDNPRMKAFVQQYNPHCEVVDSAIAVNQYCFDKQECELAFGWIGSPSTSHLLESLLPDLELLAKEIPFKLYNIGSAPMTARNFTIENHPWSAEAEQHYLPKFTVGLMPMDNDPFNQFRYSRKWLIYGCSRIPTIATDTELNRYCIEDGVSGFLYALDNSSEFRAKAKELLLNRDLRERMGQAVYEKIVRQHAVDVIGAQLVSKVASAA